MKYYIVTGYSKNLRSITWEDEYNFIGIFESEELAEEKILLIIKHDNYSKYISDSGGYRWIDYKSNNFYISSRQYNVSENVLKMLDNVGINKLICT